ncbi:hypothetical protein [Nocardia sp. NPDC051570]|uniref:hypothetical protein n=1 Tax=Nocardia sp. NPDC051570 TaxID=3364324 RepID=UPI00379AA902
MSSVSRQTLAQQTVRRRDPSSTLSSIRGQSVQMPAPITDAFDAVLTVPAITTRVDLSLGRPTRRA